LITHTPQEVAELVKQEFGVDIDRVQVATYDPTKAAGSFNISRSIKLSLILLQTVVLIGNWNIN
jgi:hypothetical protein